ncbi:MAG: GH3 auxin-responsive promoter family protein [Polyangiales bacterium]
MSSLVLRGLMQLFDHGLWLAAQTRGVLLDRHSARPRATQERVLFGLLRTAAETAFGRAHGFARIRSVTDFQQRVPLRRYAELAPWCTRALQGERDVLWPGKIPYFGMSSGTTAGNKYLPISLASVRQQQRGGFEPIAAYVRAGGARDVMSGAAILLGGTTALETRASGVLVGDNTGIMARHVPRFLQARQLPSPPVRALAAWDDKIAALAREAVTRDVRMIAGTPGWFTGLFDAVLAEAKRRGLPAQTITALWPRLRLLTGGGVRYAPYRAVIEARLGRPVPYLDVYNATEGGIMAVQDRLDDPAMRLLPDAGVFYELVPLAELDAPSPRRLPLWEAEVGGVYALAVSTPSGLFGYIIGDCLRVVSTSPHRVLFEGRTAAFLNTCGEHVSQAELERAVAAACAEQDVVLAEFTVATRVSERSVARHAYFLECDGPRPDPERLARAIDSDLARGNEDYSVHRSSALSLATPEVTLLPRGAFERFMRARNKLGGQHKVPRVLDDPQLLAQLSALAQPPAGRGAAV